VVDLAGLEMGLFASGGTGGLPPLFCSFVLPVEKCIKLRHFTLGICTFFLAEILCIVHIFTLENLCILFAHF
jgi:hypothetical protein